MAGEYLPLLQQMSPRPAKVVMPSSSAPVVELEPLPRAPKNVFLLRNEDGEHLGWRNTFQLDISYDVEMVSGILDLHNEVLATRHVPAEVSKRRFLVIGKFFFLLVDHIPF